MSDVHTPEIRSKNMAAIKSKNSVAELLVFKYLRSKNIYFQKHYTRIIGKPDIALPRQKKAIFIDGDFWHGRDIERVVISTNKPFWTNKITKNKERDLTVNKTLQELNWTILRVWETDIKRKQTQQETLEKIRLFLLSP